MIAVGATGLLLSMIAVFSAPDGMPDHSVAPIMQVASAAAEPPPPDVFNQDLRPFLKTYCSDCHSSDDPQAGIDIAKLDVEDNIVKGDGRKAWEKIFRMLETGAMPPPDVEQPASDKRRDLVAWLEDRLYNLDCDMIDDPGRVTVRRLNKAEYDNTVRDLFGVDFKPADDFPSDDVGYGFDNIGDVLSLSPLLMEKYLDAAESVAKAAIPITDSGDPTFTFTTQRLKASVGRRGEFFALSSAGEVTLDYAADLDGEYQIDIRAMADQFPPGDAQMQLRVDGKPIKTFDVTGRRSEKSYAFKTQLKEGRHRIAAAFINDKYQPNVGDRNLYVGRFVVVPPGNKSQIDAIVTARPNKSRSPKEAAATVLRPIVTRAFRRPATDLEVTRFASFVEFGMSEGESYERSLRLALQAVLVSPSFLFRVESDAQPNDPMAERNVTDYELASRLSYFLWSSMPDKELFDLASRGELRRPDVLIQQTKRMLADSKSKAIVDNFAEQWLNLNSLDEMSPDPELFPDFDDELREAMKRESLTLFATIKNDDRSVLDFLDVDFTFVNERLAKHYGIGNVKGETFQRVSLDTNQRAGILTHASILTLTSNPDRTSPVKRGKWIMENILGKEPPPPPPGVPELAETRKASPDATLRQQLEMHRADPGCASCHTTMDTIGFGFENFDATGRWRDMDGDHPVDPGGELPDGGKFQSATELVRILKGRNREFARVFSERMLTYALGRGLEYYDRCAVDVIVERLEQKNHRFSELVLGIVNSKPFLKRRGDGERQ